MKCTKKKAIRNPTIATAARLPAMPPTTAPVLIAPDTLAEEVELAADAEEVADMCETEANELVWTSVARAAVGTTVEK